MENLKIKVNTESESKEAQELFFELGCYWGESGKEYIDLSPYPCDIKKWGNQQISYCHAEHHYIDCKETTLPELRDLVVLKRNDVGDATHTDGHYDFYVGKDKNYFFSSCDKAWRGTWKNAEILKPIEKPMKEYLRKNSNGTYSYIGTVRPEHVSDFMIEIPEGATYYAKDANLGKSGNFFFRLRSDGFDFEAVWLESNWMQASFNVKNQEVLWQRHTHPEELPFIDDEPSLNDQYAEIEKVRQDIINSPGHYADSTIECIDAMEAMMTPEQFIGYLRGNVFKYQWRYEKKNGIEDLKKAQWYLDKLTEKVAEKNAPF